MRVVIMVEFFPVNGKDAPTGGVEQRAAAIAKRLDHEVLVLCSHQPGQPREHKFGNVRVRRVGPSYPYSNSGNIFPRLGFAYRLIIEALKSKADVIDAESFLCYLPGALARRFGSSRVIATYHECWLGNWIRIKGIITGTFGTVWERLSLLLGFDKVIAVSESTRKQLERHGVSSVVVPNGVPLSEFRKASPRKIVTFIGRLVPGKNCDILLRAAALMNSDVKVMIIGDGPERNRLEAMARRFGIDAEFKGRMRTGAMRRILSSSVAFCLPSSVEGFGISAVEAMASGVPVVAADIPPLREVVGKAGLLVPVRNEKATAAALDRIIQNKSYRKLLSKAASERAKKYDWDVIVRDYEKAIMHKSAGRR